VLALSCATVARASTSASPSSYTSEYVSLYNQITQIFSKDKGNCVKMATDLKAWGVSHKTQLAQLQAEAPKLSKIELAGAALRVVGQITSDAETIAQDVTACATNPQVQAALAAENKLTKP
jgi:hypothetical protein